MEILRASFAFRKKTEKPSLETRCCSHPMNLNDTNDDKVEYWECCRKRGKEGERVRVEKDGKSTFDCCWPEREPPPRTACHKRKRRWPPPVQPNWQDGRAGDRQLTYNLSGCCQGAFHLLPWHVEPGQETWDSTSNRSYVICSIDQTPEATAA